VMEAGAAAIAVGSGSPSAWVSIVTVPVGEPAATLWLVTLGTLTMVALVA